MQRSPRSHGRGGDVSLDRKEQTIVNEEAGEVLLRGAANIARINTLTELLAFAQMLRDLDVITEEQYTEIEQHLDARVDDVKKAAGLPDRDTDASSSPTS